MIDLRIDPYRCLSMLPRVPHWLDCLKRPTLRPLVLGFRRDFLLNHYRLKPLWQTCGQQGRWLFSPIGTAPDPARQTSLPCLGHAAKHRPGDCHRSFAFFARRVGVLVHGQVFSATWWESIVPDSYLQPLLKK